MSFIAVGILVGPSVLGWVSANDQMFGSVEFTFTLGGDTEIFLGFLDSPLFTGLGFDTADFNLWVDGVESTDGIFGNSASTLSEASAVFADTAFIRGILGAGEHTLEFMLTMEVTASLGDAFYSEMVFGSTTVPIPAAVWLWPAVFCRHGKTQESVNSINRINIGGLRVADFLSGKSNYWPETLVP